MPMSYQFKEGAELRCICEVRLGHRMLLIVVSQKEKLCSNRSFNLVVENLNNQKYNNAFNSVSMRMMETEMEAAITRKSRVSHGKNCSDLSSLPKTAVSH